MRRLLISFIMLCTTTTLLAACGGGGGGGETGTAEPTQAVVKITASGELPAGVLIGGIDVTIPLPAGVSVKAAADGANPDVLVIDPGAATVSGAAAGTDATVIGVYTASPNAVTIKVINPSGFATGEFVTVLCDITAGTTVAATDFSPAAFSAVDLNGAAISGLAAGLTVELR